MKKNKSNLKEPLVRIVKRDNIKLPKIILIYAVAVIAGLLLSGFVSVLFSEKGIGDFFQSLFAGAFGSERKIWLLLQETSLLLGTSMALLPAFKMKFWNLGGNGQILVSCLAAIACMFYLGGKVSDSVIIPLMLVTSVAAGALWAVIPAIFKAKFNTNESLFTLMMNYIAIQLVNAMTELWRGKASSIGKINADTQLGWLPKLKVDVLPEIFGQRYLLNVIIVIALVFFMYFYLKRSKQGYEISVVGESENTARYAGINVKKVIIRTMIISGAICGLLGFLTVAGKDQTISAETAGGNGFTAIIVAWVAKFNTFTMAGIAFLLILLQRGAAGIASQYGLNTYLTDIVSGIVLFFILGCEFFINYKLVFRSSKKEAR